jgi:hypothetical protein
MVEQVAVCGAETLCHSPLGGVGSVAERNLSGSVRVQGIPSRKNRPRRVHIPKGWRRTVGRKHPAGQRPSKEGSAEPAEGTPWGFGFGLLRRSEKKKREGHEEGRNRFECPSDEHLEGAQAQEGTVPVLTRTGWESRWVPLMSRAKAAGAPVSGRSV